jgi:hypothetical protein
MDEKVLNQQRALWLTPNKARNIVIDRNIKLQEEKKLKKEKEDDHLNGYRNDLKSRAVTNTIRFSGVSYETVCFVTDNYRK